MPEVFGTSDVSLALRIGGATPLPVSPLVLSALSATEVLCDSERGAAFRLTFRVHSVRWPAEYTQLAQCLSKPLSRLYVAALLGATSHPLIDGVVTEHQIVPDGGGTYASLTLTGQDLGVLLDQEERSVAYENRSDEAIADTVLGRYAQHGLSSESSAAAPQAGGAERTVWQTETDLAFLHRLARRNGYQFAIEPRAAGKSSAYFGPPPRDAPQKALHLEPGQARNVRSLQLRGDMLARARVLGATLDPQSQRLLSVDSTRGDSGADALRVRWLRQLGAADQGGAERAVKAEAAAAADPITAEGELDTLDYRALLRPRRRVTVSGLPLNQDGTYVVRSVTHVITDGRYLQRFRLAREPGAGGAG